MPIFFVEFNLKSKAPTTVENGDVIFNKGQSRVTVRNIQADSQDDAIDKARPKAEAFLDDLYFRYEMPLETSGTGLAVGIQDSQNFRHSHSYATLEILGGHGKEFPDRLKQVVIKASDAKAYYRKAATSQDSFSKFANLFLVIENIATKIVKNWSTETELIKRALKICFSSGLEDLEHFMRQRRFEYKGDIIEEVTRIIYIDNRVQLFHSKQNSDKKIPYKLEDEERVQRFLPLAEFVAKSLLAYEDTNLLP